MSIALARRGSVYRLALLGTALLLVLPALSVGFASAVGNAPAPQSSPSDPSSSVTVNSVDQDGATITGYYTALTNSGGSVVASGFTPSTFTTSVGTTYGISAASYGSCTFSKWSDGVTSDPRTFTASSSAVTFTAVYNCGGSVSSVTVDSVNQAGAAITGYYVVLSTSAGSKVATGYTPATFNTTSGTAYNLMAESYGSCTFASWSNGQTSNPLTFTAGSSPVTFTAHYQCTGVTNQSSSVTVNSVNQNGVAISGYWTVLYSSGGSVVSSGFTPATFTTTSGQSYMVSVSNYGSCSFSQWSDGSTSNPRSFTASGSPVTFTAQYYCSSGTTSTVTVDSVDQDGNALSGFPVTMTYSGSTAGSGSTPATFNTVVGYTYQLSVGNANGCTFSYWASISTNDAPISFTATSSPQTITAVFDCNNGGPSSVTVYAHRVPAGYWAPCFATVCAAGTGPGAGMYFALTYTNGTVKSSGFSDENGLVFAGLKPGVTYVLYADDCDSCHGSTHDVLFDHWGNGSTVDPVYVVAGTVLDAWFTCTNGCGGD